MLPLQGVKDLVFRLMNSSLSDSELQPLEFASGLFQDSNIATWYCTRTNEVQRGEAADSDALMSNCPCVPRNCVIATTSTTESGNRGLHVRTTTTGNVLYTTAETADHNIPSGTKVPPPVRYEMFWKNSTTEGTY